MTIKIEPIAGSKLPFPEKLGFGNVFSDRMFTQTWTADKGWHDAKFGPFENISLSPATAVFHYAQEIFEGTKAYRRPDGHIDLFRPWENAHRFNRSASAWPWSWSTPNRMSRRSQSWSSLSTNGCPAATASRSTSARP